MSTKETPLEKFRRETKLEGFKRVEVRIKDTPENRQKLKEYVRRHLQR